MAKSKYGDLIRKAREPEKQETREPDDESKDSESQKTIQPADQAVVRLDNQITEKPENQKIKEPEKEVNLCIKVPESLRRHWAAEAKRDGITMTEVMVGALIKRFGKPDNQITR